MKNKYKNSVIVGTIPERVYAPNSDVLEARAAGTIQRHLKLASIEPADGNWVGTYADGSRVKVEIYDSLQYGQRTGSGYREHKHNVSWSGEYRLTPLA